ncbi:MAG: hypothetical protein ACD_75C01521G0004, partial [uncultured bacterium]
VVHQLMLLLKLLFVKKNWRTCVPIFTNSFLKKQERNF